jgi:hypothetical protein
MWAHCGQMEEVSQQTVGKVAPQDGARGPGCLDQTFCRGGIGAVLRIY